MSNKSFMISGNSRQSRVFWNQSSGVKALMLRAGIFLDEKATTPVVWNPADKDSNTTLSDSNHLATGGGGSDTGVRADTGRNTGKLYFEFNNVLSGGLRETLGFATIGASLTTDATLVVGLNHSGGAIAGGGGHSNLGSPSGQNIGVAVDIDNGLWWFTYDGTNWYGYTGTPNPATNTQGVDYTATIPAGTPIYPYVLQINFFGSATCGINCGDRTFAHPVPSGFTPWDQGAALPPAPVGTWSSTETADAFAASGTPSLAGPWASVEAKDTMAFVGGIPDTGVWTDTEAPDTFKSYIAVPPTGTWASTEAPDEMDTLYYAHQPRFEVESVVSTASSDNYNTNGPNRIMCVIGAFGSAGSISDQITGITDSAGNVWHRQDLLISPKSINNQYINTEMWWSYAKNKITGGTITITTGGGFSFTHNLFALVSIKGLGGNFNNPFSDTNPFSFGGDIGAFFSAVNTQPHSSTPVATGPLSSGGSVSNPITFDPASVHGCTLDGTNLKVTSTGSGGPNNYVTIPYRQTLTQGKIYIEAKFVHIAGSKYGFGVTVASDSNNQITDTIANGGSGTMIRGDGTIWINGVQIASIGAVPADGDVIGIALDFDNGIFWARDVTQNSNYNNSATALPVYGSSHFTSGGSYIAGDTPPDRSGAGAHGMLGGAWLPFANVDGTSSSAEMDLNFGQAAFVGTPPAGYQAGWGTPIPAVTPTRVEQHAIVLGWSTTNPDDAITQFPPGFNLHYTHIGDISAGIRLTVYSKLIAQNILTTDNEFMTQPTATSQWAALYDTIVSDIVSPGTLESTEAADSFHAVGYGPGGAGLFGFMTTSEATDTAHFVGAVAVTGRFLTIENADTFSAFISVPIRGTFNTTEAADRFAGTGIGLGEDGVWISTEGLDTLTINGVVPISGTFNTSETADRFLAIGAGVTTSRRRRRRTFVT